MEQGSITENDRLFKETNKSPYSHLSWKYYGAYRCIGTIKCFILGQRKIKSETNTFSETAEALISANDKADTQTLKAGRDLLRLQRDVENTRARRRLERWACKVIVAYLLLVFILLLLNGASMIWFPNVFYKHGFISDNVFITILSTTTINILGLVVIVLRGHFETGKNKNQEQFIDNAE